MGRQEQLVTVTVTNNNIFLCSVRPSFPKASVTRGWKKIAQLLEEKKLPKFLPRNDQIRIIYIKAQFESPKYIYQTMFSNRLLIWKWFKLGK
jgi:hypothetical protein